VLLLVYQTLMIDSQDQFPFDMNALSRGSESGFWHSVLKSRV